jgi:hypothetical protein
MKCEMVIWLITLLPCTLCLNKKPWEVMHLWYYPPLEFEYQVDTPESVYENISRRVLASTLHHEPIQSHISYRLEFELIKFFSKGTKPMPKPLSKFLEETVKKFFDKNHGFPFTGVLNVNYDWFNGKFIEWIIREPEMYNFSLEGVNINDFKLELAIQVYYYFTAGVKKAFLRQQKKPFYPIEVLDIDEWIVKSLDVYDLPIDLVKDTFADYSQTVGYILKNIYHCSFQRWDYWMPDRGYGQHLNDFDHGLRPFRMETALGIPDPSRFHSEIRKKLIHKGNRGTGQTMEHMHDVLEKA